MTLDEFFEQLEKLGKGKFAVLENSKAIRKKSKSILESVCPIEYVYAKLHHRSLSNIYGAVDYAADQLKLSRKDCSDILWAADGDALNPQMYKRRLKLRKRMLKTLGLEDE